MSTEMAIIIIALGAAAFIFKWYADFKHREAASKFFNQALDKQIQERDAAIAAKKKESADAVEAYFQGRAEYNRNRKSDEGNE